MSLQDPIADMLTRIRNAQMVNRKTVQVPFSKLKLSVAHILKQEGYILDCYKTDTSGKFNIILYLKYHMGTPVITCIQRVSRPGLRVYRNASKLPKTQDSLGITLVSTSQGVMTDKLARSKHCGGEVLLYVY